MSRHHHPHAEREPDFLWLPTGDEALAEMCRAIRAARHSVRLEMYIIRPGPQADEFLDALAGAAARGAEVRVLADALGSMMLPDYFWDKLTSSGGTFRSFNPLDIARFGLRDHRKLLVCDEEAAFVGGLNIAPEYAGDGVRGGWRDLALRLRSPAARDLARAFDEMFDLADFRHPPFAWLRTAARQRVISHPPVRVLLNAPGWRIHPMLHSLEKDFARAAHIRIACAYFLPTRRLHRALRRAARNGARVQILLPGPTDVPLLRTASHGLYRRLLRAGVELYEYHPQILHSKLIVLDDAAIYVGSANLDVRSLHLNYELLARIADEKCAREAAEIFDADLAHARRVDFEEWKRTRWWWPRLKSRVAHFLLARLDPYLAAWQLRRLRKIAAKP